MVIYEHGTKLPAPVNSWLLFSQFVYNIKLRL